MMTAVVLGAEDDPVWCDEHGRVKVRILGLDPLDEANPQAHDTTAWVRVDFMWAGDGFGIIFPLWAGMEVSLGWDQGAVERPVITGCRYNSRNVPPRFDHLGCLPHNRALNGIVTREHNGPQQQQLRFNNTHGKVSTQLGTDHAATQLNMGCLSTPMNEGWTEPRGHGIELLTDGHGVMRAGDGMLITTEARPKAQGHITDMAETVERLTTGQTQHDNLSTAAQQAKAHETGDQDEVVQALKAQAAEIKGHGGNPAQGKFPEFQAPHLTLASPAGIQTTTQGSTHVASVEHNAFTSGLPT